MIAEELEDIWLGDAEVWRRPAQGTANPLGGRNPYISPEGHTIVDIRFLNAFTQEIGVFPDPVATMAQWIQETDGVVSCVIISTSELALLLFVCA